MPVVAVLEVFRWAAPMARFALLTGHALLKLRTTIARIDATTTPHASRTTITPAMGIATFMMTAVLDPHESTTIANAKCLGILGSQAMKYCL